MNFRNVKDFMDRLCDWLMPGNVCVIYKDGKKVFEYAAGYSDKEENVKMTGNEHFNIYSCSKVATVTAAMQLFEKGYFLMSTPLYEFIPEFRDMKCLDENGNVTDCKNPITIFNLFTMTSGLLYGYPKTLSEMNEKYNGNVPTLEFVKAIAKNEVLSFNPGTRFQYSYSHDVLAAVVEVISGMRFSEYMRKNIFEPLEMYKTFYHTPDNFDGVMAKQYIYKVTETDIVKLQGTPVNEQGVLERADWGNNLVYGNDYDSGGAGIITTMDDYVLLMNALCNDGYGTTGERIISKASIELMRTPHITQEQFKYCTWANMVGYAYGLGVRTMLDKTIGSGSLSNIGEFGWGGAAGASVFADPKERLAVSYTHHMLNPLEWYYQPRLRNAIYSSL